ncbi:MAG: tRNA (N6-isopentenyl adenosine(37)-C2)-methylthiotransferase MiaB [Defluviitaleaceae bacterium]|nr:tRNA (N6-isopentenyl adenosine(37)-C2)-methylthiotransferase MiaB [Defluviitaleaceae bacterium]
MDSDIQNELNRIDEYMARVRQWAAGRENPPRAHVCTFGCQMNVRDSEKLAGMLVGMGYEMVDDEDSADFVVMNTCCVRENAENRVYGRLGQLKAKKAEDKDFRIGVCGCMPQQDVVVDTLKRSYRFVDIIFGTFNIHRLPQLLWDSISGGGQIVDIWREHGGGAGADDLPAIREHRHKSGVNIMYGCDNFCTYCIVPYVRGRERSRSAADILAEIRDLVADGVVEIMLLGQNVNSYGAGADISFPQLLRQIAAIPGLLRIRFMTSHPKDLSDELISAMADCDNICKHLHLPVQAGGDAVLEKMNRGYTKEGYLELINRARSAIPGLAITTDIMAGFPGESDADFEDTMDIVRRARFAGAFTFYYSKRHGTAAAAMENQIDETTAKSRFDRLLAEVNRITAEINAEKLGREMVVIPDNIGRNGLLDCRADDNSLVHIPGGEEMLGIPVKIKIIDAKSFYLLGGIIE